MTARGGAPVNSGLTLIGIANRFLLPYENDIEKPEIIGLFVYNKFAQILTLFLCKINKIWAIVKSVSECLCKVLYKVAVFSVKIPIVKT